MLGLAQTQTPTVAAHPPPTQNQSLAKHNRKPSQLIENNHQHPKSIASFCRVFLDYSPPRNSPPLFRSDSTAAPPPRISLPNFAGLACLGVRRLAAAFTSRSLLRRSLHKAIHPSPASTSFAPPQMRTLPLPASRCIPARPCASIRLSAGSCAQPPGGGAVMMYASLYMSDCTPVLSPCEMPIRSCLHPKKRVCHPERSEGSAFAFPFSNFSFPFSALHLIEVKNEKLQH